MDARILKRLLLLLLAASAAPAGLAESSFEGIEEKADAPQGYLETRFVELLNHGLDGTNSGFAIRVTCNRPFQVKGLYATLRDDVAVVEIDYVRVVVLGGIFGPDFASPWGWEVAHEDFSTTASTESTGFELLSTLQVPALGVAGGGFFDVRGTRQPNTGVTTLTVGALVETAQDLKNSCEIIVLDN